MGRVGHKRTDTTDAQTGRHRAVQKVQRHLTLNISRDGLVYINPGDAYT